MPQVLGVTGVAYMRWGDAGRARNCARGGGGGVNRSKRQFTDISGSKFRAIEMLEEYDAKNPKK